MAILLVSLVAPLLALHTVTAEDSSNENEDLRIVPEDDAWYKLETDMITVLFPRGGQKPMFIWWYTGSPNQIYVVKYQGLIEYFTFEGEFYTRMREALRERFEEMFLAQREHEMTEMEPMNMSRLELLWSVKNEIESTWHRPFFPFNAATWSLSEIKNITTNGNIIGVSFAFKLVDVPDWMPNLQFAENNIMIRVRFYNTTVEETDPDTGYKYTVNAGEMKMDFVINKWVWNIDAIKQLIAKLNENGIDVNVPPGKTRLALWVNLASINITKLQEAEDKPEEIEDFSTATHMEVDDSQEDIRPNMTETSLEKPIEISAPVIKLGFANETTTLGGFFRFVSSAKVKDFPQQGDANMVPVKAAYISAGAHMRLFIGYPYFGNGTLEHDPSIGVDVSGTATTPKYKVETPSGINEIAPTVIGEYALPLFTTPLVAALVSAVSIVAILIYAVKWKRKTPVNVVGAR